MPATTSIERGLLLLRKAAIFATTIMGLTLLVYVGGGCFLVGTGTLVLPYPHLSLDADPVLLFIVSAVGFFITVTMAAQIFLTLLMPTSSEETLIIVILSSIGGGLGGVTFYYSLEQVIEIVS